MGPATVTASRIYKYGESGRLTMESLRRTARIKTFSNDAQTTDSAPSMAAYMTGVKMNNEVISMSANTVATAPSADVNGNRTINNCAPTNGTSVPTLLELAKAKGKATGAITTTELTHATPAATYSISATAMRNTISRPRLCRVAWASTPRLAMVWMC